MGRARSQWHGNILYLLSGSHIRAPQPVGSTWPGLSGATEEADWLPGQPKRLICKRSSLRQEGLLKQCEMYAADFSLQKQNVEGFFRPRWAGPRESQRRESVPCKTLTPGITHWRCLFTRKSRVIINQLLWPRSVSHCEIMSLQVIIDI